MKKAKIEFDANMSMINFIEMVELVRDRFGVEVSFDHPEVCGKLLLADKNYTLVDATDIANQKEPIDEDKHIPKPRKMINVFVGHEMPGNTRIFQNTAIFENQYLPHKHIHEIDIAIGDKPINSLDDKKYQIKTTATEPNFFHNAIITLIEPEFINFKNGYGNTNKVHRKDIISIEEIGNEERNNS